MIALQKDPNAIMFFFSPWHSLLIVETWSKDKKNPWGSLTIEKIKIHLNPEFLIPLCLKNSSHVVEALVTVWSKRPDYCEVYMAEYVYNNILK